MLNYYNEQVFHPISTLAQCATIELCQWTLFMLPSIEAGFEQ